MEAQPAENVDEAGTLHRGLPLLFGEEEHAGEKGEGNAGHVVEEEVEQGGKTAETEGRLLLLSQLEREKINPDKESDKLAHPPQLFSAVASLAVLLVFRTHD